MNLARNTNTIVLILASVAAIIAVFLFVAPIPQDPAYHNFSDTRMLFGIDNFWNVASNLPFLLVGVAGLFYVHRHSDVVCVSGLETAYRVFFVGILLTAFGSGYYHLAPGNGALVWDRLPMTIGFAGLFSIIVGEFVSVRAARRLLLPLLVVGLASVGYWALTEVPRRRRSATLCDRSVLADVADSGNPVELPPCDRHSSLFLVDVCLLFHRQIV